MVESNADTLLKSKATQQRKETEANPYNAKKDYIDYELQFSKAFIEPMSSVMNSVGWKTERVSTLEDFFG